MSDDRCKYSANSAVDSHWYSEAQLQPGVKRTPELIRDSFVASVIRSNSLAVSEPAPDFELPDARGNPISLARLTSAGPVVVLFLHGRWCPYCRSTTAALGLVSAAISAAGGQLVVITSDDQGTTCAAPPELEGHLLSDIDGHVADLFGLLLNSPGNSDGNSGLNGVVLHQRGGRPLITVPATFVIDRGGLVTYAAIDPEHLGCSVAGTVISELQRLDVASGT